ncbi:prolyl oligopeptidase family serine peptidase [Streptomyces sp. MST-110588]|uniref:prolyl oligopeptidase family serine peptidase n=1 Tax=Streptomyces sp. MST-110588 TaxID=2833628 RepID=UPI001F5CFE27|nr:prolyl oligopeptidase family serine peptidase [Streptomyces sp. MST-110588]
MTGQLSFPRQHARTQRFSLGSPRGFAVSPDGRRVTFIRSRTGIDRANLLWVLDLDEGREFAVADPVTLLAGAAEELSPEERARRERTREGSAGVVNYAVDAAVELAAFTLSGRLFVSELRAGTTRELPVPGPVVDPRPSPDGRHVAYVSMGALRVVATDERPAEPDATPASSTPGSDAPGRGSPHGGTPGSGLAENRPSGGGQHRTATPAGHPLRDRVLAEPDGPGVTWGLAEFIAAEEMARHRGFWWSPDSDRLLAARVDESAVQRWWIADPARPDRRPSEITYPAAGTPNADVGLALLDLDGGRTDVVWDRERYPYLARVHWSAAGPPLLLVQTRDQREQRYLTVDTATGATSTLLVEQDPAWLELHPGVPAWTPDGRLVRIADEDGARKLFVDGRPLTAAPLHVRAVLDIGEQDVLFSASGRDNHDIGVYRACYRHVGDDGHGTVDEAGDEAGSHGRHTTPPAEAAKAAKAAEAAQGWERVAARPYPSVSSAVRAGEITVLSHLSAEHPRTEVEVVRLTADGTGTPLAAIGSYAETPVITARPRFVTAGEREIPCAVLLPTGYRDADGPLPVLMDPYGGPHGQRVVAAHNAHLTSQWFADQGFAVIVADGRGTPGRSPAWEKDICRDVAAKALQDQIDALHALAGSFPLDLGRVGIRGWSFGGMLAGLAVLRRPDVFHAGVVGAPVTDQRLYDTHYTERYYGHPDQDPEVYRVNSLVDDGGLVEAADQHRPMLIMHGLADDNVVAAHTLRLSSALLAAGRPHEVLPLSGVTHMTPQEQVAENLLLLQVAFLKRSLGMS